MTQLTPEGSRPNSAEMSGTAIWKVVPLRTEKKMMKLKVTVIFRSVLSSATRAGSFISLSHEKSGFVSFPGMAHGTAVPAVTILYRLEALLYRGTGISSLDFINGSDIL